MKKEIQSNQIKYTVQKADKKQKNLVFKKFYKYKEKRDAAIVFVAAGKRKKIMGYLIAEEKAVPPPLNGEDWFIWQIYTLPAYRRQGIASALLNETIKQAERAGVRHLQGSANPTIEAHMFWFKHNFCFQRYGNICNDADRPLECGNYYHMIFYRIDKAAKENIKGQAAFRIIRAGKEHTEKIFDEHIYNKSAPFFKDKKEDIFALTALDKDENIIGFIAACEDGMYAPLDEKQWWIPYVYVPPEFRRKGVGGALLRELVKLAAEAEITQLTAVNTGGTEEFLYDNDFDVMIWHIASDEIKPVTAARRI